MAESVLIRCVIIMATAFCAMGTASYDLDMFDGIEATIALSDEEMLEYTRPDVYDAEPLLASNDQSFLCATSHNVYDAEPLLASNDQSFLCATSYHVYDAEPLLTSNDQPSLCVISDQLPTYTAFDVQNVPVFYNQTSLTTPEHAKHQFVGWNEPSCSSYTDDQPEMHAYMNYSPYTADELDDLQKSYISDGQSETLHSTDRQSVLCASDENMVYSMDSQKMQSNRAIDNSSSLVHTIDSGIYEWPNRHSITNREEKRIIFQKKPSKQIYLTMLSCFWRVFYGHYNGREKEIRFHIECTDDLSFMRTKMDGSVDTAKMCRDILWFVSKTNSLRSKEIKSMMSSEMPFNEKTEISCFCKKCLMVFNDPSIVVDENVDWVRTVLSNLKNHITIEDKASPLFFNGLMPGNIGQLDVNDLYSASSTYALVEHADAFFQVLAICSMLLKSIRNVNMISIYRHQLCIFFTDNLHFKLLLFPEFMSLCKYADRIKSARWQCNYYHRLYVCYYAMHKFEIFIGHLKMLLCQNGPLLVRLHAHDVLFCKTYVAELYLMYIYMDGFDLSISCTLKCIYLNRLQLLCILEGEDDIVNMNRAKLITFVLYNLIDSHLIFNLDRQLMNIILEMQFKVPACTAKQISGATCSMMFSRRKQCWMDIASAFMKMVQDMSTFIANSHEIVNEIAYCINHTPDFYVNNQTVIGRWTDAVMSGLIYKINQGY